MSKAKTTSKPSKVAAKTKAKPSPISAKKPLAESEDVASVGEAILEETTDSTTTVLEPANPISEADETKAPPEFSWDSVVNRFSPEFMERAWEFLVRSAPTRETWALLGQPENLVVKMRITKGFQSTANSLRLPVVRHRLQDELKSHPDLTAKILHLWSATTPPPPSIAAAQEFEADTNLLDQLPDLNRRFTLEVMLLSLLALHRYEVITLWSEKVVSGDWTLESPAIEDEPQETSPSDEIPTLQKQLEAARTENKKLQQRVEKAEQKLREAQGALASTKDNFARETHELQARLKQEENRFVREHEKLAEDERLLDRTTRKLKSAEKQVEELEQENKKFKKQVRQQQEISEELQKEIAGLNAQIEDLKNDLKTAPATSESQTATAPARPERKTAPDSYLRAPSGPLPAVMVPASRTVSSAPLDQVFQWNADGRTIRVTTREIKRGIDANNEGWVFALIQALDALRHASPEAYRLLMERVRELDVYYHRVLTVRTTRILVDASNVARYERNRFGKGQMRFLLAMRDELRRRGCFPIRFIADASLPYNVDTPEELVAMERRGELELTNAGQEADEVLAREARRTGAFVVTNDRTFHMKTSPNFEPPRLSFHFYEKHLVMDDF
ncbi:MAG TPA: hypothetical protein VGB77_20350 [Abditibacteriaceae bacterium]|jgi:hypothetical protein